MKKKPLMGAIACILTAGLASSTPAGSPEAAQAKETQDHPVTSFPVACSVDTPVVQESGSVLVRAWAASPDGRIPEYVWTTTVGKISGSGWEERWDLAGVSPASLPVETTVRVRVPTGPTATCSVQVIVEKKELQIARGKETGRSFLVKGKNEVTGYGLYSYLLLGSPPVNSNRERYVKTIEAYLATIVKVTALEDYIKRSQLNVTYLPVTVVPTSKASADWMLDHYDYARARALLNLLHGNLREGPYLVSVLKPLEAGAARDQYLLQNLSGVPANADLVSWWVREFLNQTAQERFWEPRTGSLLVLKLRTTIAALAMGLPDVRKGLESWISWIH